MYQASPYLSSLVGQILPSHLPLFLHKGFYLFWQPGIIIEKSVQVPDKFTVCSGRFHQFLEAFRQHHGFFSDSVEARQFFKTVLLFTFDKVPLPHGAFNSVFDSVIFKVRNLIGCQIAESRFKQSEKCFRPVFSNNNV